MVNKFLINTFARHLTIANHIRELGLSHTFISQEVWLTNHDTQEVSGSSPALSTLLSLHEESNGIGNSWSG